MIKAKSQCARQRLHRPTHQTAPSLPEIPMQQDNTTHTISAPSENTALGRLLNTFELACVKPDHYIGQSLDLGFRNLFGGHILGQALVAAGNTCEQRNAHSLHAYFIRGGDPRAPIDYNVDRIRDGNSFSVRRVTA
ncbi:MAG: thioesterase family protein, partial [Undibacterium sp.]|nr:thioesterase family protein [Undibacterium sp.]